MGSSLLYIYLQRPELRELQILNSKRHLQIDFDSTFIWDIIHKKKLVTTRSVQHEPHVSMIKENDRLIATSRRLTDTPFCIIVITEIRRLRFFELAREDELALKENVNSGIELQELLLTFYPELRGRETIEGGDKTLDEMVILNYEVLLPSSPEWNESVKLFSGPDLRLPLQTNI